MADVAPTLTFPPHPVDREQVLNALVSAVLVVDGAGAVRYANQAAEALLGASEAALCRLTLADLFGPDSALDGLAARARRDLAVLVEHDLRLDSPRLGAVHLDAEAAAMIEPADHVVLSLHDRALATKIGRQLQSKGAARSVSGLAAMLAHEIKNPLSGIRGAAQLLEHSAGQDDQALTRLICAEVDRIRALVDQMETFSDPRPIVPQPENIHEILSHVRQLTAAGCARHVRFVERYDPSLPPVAGHRNRLIQVFLNLIKNAAEATDGPQAEIVLSTAYRHGFRVAQPGHNTPVELPLEVTVADNGPGIADELLDHLFEPFVSVREGGTGLGLALVAKFVGDHGGVVECENGPHGAVFRVLLPAWRGGR